MRALLINPFQVNLVARKGRIYNRTWTPLDLANTAAVLEQAGVNATVIDANAEQLPPQDVARRSQGYDKVFITSTALDRWQCPQLDLAPFLATVRAVREVAPELYVMGTHGTVKPVDMLVATGARAIIRGEPERTVLEICSNGYDLSKVLGVTYLDGEQVRHTANQKAVDLGKLPLPAFDHLPMDRYHYELMGRPFTLFEMSRGCASHCTFCSLNTYGPGVRRKHTDQLIQEVEYAIRRFGIRAAYFFDLEFTVLRKQVIDLCRHLIRKQYDFTWCCQTRLDLVDDELLTLMKQAGCRLIHCGVEAGSDRVLGLVEKGITVREIEDGVAKVMAAGIDVACFFVLGLPGTTHEDVKDSIHFATRLNPTYPLFHVAAPYPGTRMYDQVLKDSRFRFSDDSLFPEAVEGDFTLAELKAITRQAYLEYYLRPSYIVRRLGKGQLRVLANQVRLYWAMVNS